MMVNATLQKFSYPHLEIANNDSWVVLLRRPQITLGSLVLVTRHNETSFSGLGQKSFLDLQPIVQSIEKTLKKLWQYDKINYLMLMMIDPHVHWHIIPRYQQSRQWENRSFIDKNWPKPPDLSQAIDMSDETENQLLKLLRLQWDY